MIADRFRRVVDASDAGAGEHDVAANVASSFSINH
jgi:hypothetical protein